MRNVKFIIPFAAVAVFATTSCGNAVSRLNREYYGEKVETLEKLKPIINDCGENQVDDNGIYKLPDQGTFTGKASLTDNINVSVLGLDLDGGLSPLAYDIDDINIGFGNEVTSTWDFKTKNVYGVTSTHGDVCFVKQVATGEKDEDGKDKMEWRKYLSQPIGGAKYYVNLDNIGDEGLEDASMFKSIKNYIMVDVARNNGFYEPKDYPVKEWHEYCLDGIGLDMSGFGGNLMKIEKQKVESADSINETKVKYGFDGYYNLLAPGQLLNDNLKIEGIPVYKLIDAIVAGVQLEFIKVILPEGTLVANYTTDGKNATMEFTINLDVTNIQGILDQIPISDSHTAGDAVKVGRDSSGTISLSYFVNFKDNFVHQQELTLDFNKVNLQLIADLSMFDDDSQAETDAYDVGILDIKQTEIHAYIGGLFESGKFVENKVPDQNIEGYFPLNPMIKVR